MCASQFLCKEAGLQQREEEREEALLQHDGFFAAVKLGGMCLTRFPPISRTRLPNRFMRHSWLIAGKAFGPTPMKESVDTCSLCNSADRSTSWIRWNTMERLRRTPSLMNVMSKRPSVALELIMCSLHRPFGSGDSQSDEAFRFLVNVSTYSLTSCMVRG